MIGQKPNFRLVIATNSYIGSFIHELVSYAFGTLNKEKMETSDFKGKYEMSRFWGEEFNSEPKSYDDAYELRDCYLMETLQSGEDGKHTAFYYTENNENGRDCSLVIQLYQPLIDYWEEIVIRRIVKFFEFRPFINQQILPSHAQIMGIFMLDDEGFLVKKCLTKKIKEKIIIEERKKDDRII